MTTSSDQSLGELVAHATQDLSLLVRQELQLAKLELKTEVVSAGKGAGMLGAAGFSGVFGLVFLSIAAAYGISWLGIGLGWGFLVVGLLYVLAAAVLALGGKKNLQKVGPPEKTLETVRDDIAFAKHPTQAPARRS
ncbi:MAG: hypothetical protein JWN17_904 [Frankiales bacterium]|nr:hypothetical protein [Frankiales bacterium]